MGKRMRLWLSKLEDFIVRTRKPVAATILVAALVIDLLAWTGVVAANEPKVVLHLSTWALIYAAYTAMLVAER